MAELFEYKCPNCGGKIEFDSTTQKMKCPYCDSEFEVETLKNMDARLEEMEPDTFDWNTENNDSAEWTENDGVSVFVCKSCGGEIVGDENTAATSCPYCGNPVVMAGRLSGDLKPDFVIPFKLDKKAAKEALKNYVSKKRFAPNTFKSENRLDEIKGIYVPFWLFDSDANASVSYDATRTRHWSDSKYEYTETSHFDVFRAGTMRFENIPVDGSSKMPDDLMESIEPFRFDEAVDFQTAYLSGYLADKYDVTKEQSIDRANQRVKVSCEDTLRNTVTGFETVTTKDSFVQTTNGVAKYALYPVWILNTVYKNEKLTFGLNGQTGKIVGNIPVSKAKLAALFAGVTAVGTPLIFLVGRLFGIL
ncbi:MAG: hypothetical protein E7571_00700 [Ruminococcaceae bacterium]|nr:hypothetical protein [Oscillospiraceae bacterium]